MSEERLKGWVSYSQKVEGASKYLPLEYSSGHEYWVDESRPAAEQDAEEWEKLGLKAVERLKQSGLIK